MLSLRCVPRPSWVIREAATLMPFLLRSASSFAERPLRFVHRKSICGIFAQTRTTRVATTMAIQSFSKLLPNWEERTGESSSGRSCSDAPHIAFPFIMAEVSSKFGCGVIRWFWEIVDEMEEEEKAQLLKFSTSCSRAPLLGFKVGYSRR